jgi:hypothetical protein
MGKSNLFDKLKTTLDGFQKQFEDVYKQATSPKVIIDQMMSLDAEASKLAKRFGTGRENIESINKALSESITNVILYGGEWDDVAKTQDAISKSLGRNVLSTSETVESLFRTFKVTGQDTALLSANFKDIGFSAGKIESQMQKVVDSARKIGVSAEAVSKQAVDNLSAMNKYNFQGGVEGLAKMAAQAVSLRVDMKDTLSLADKMFNPEQAIEMAASMQRLGVAQSDLLDPLRLMELGQNDPTELQNQLAQMSKQFVQLNKDGQFEILPGAKLKMRELEESLRLGAGTLSKMAISGAELDDKLEKIKFPADMGLDDEKKQFIANLAEMDKDGEYKIKIGADSLGIEEAMDVFRDSPEKLEQLMKDQAPKSMEQLARDQLSTLDEIKKQTEAMATYGYSFGASKTGVDALSLMRGVSKTTGEATRKFSPAGAILGADTKTQTARFDKYSDSIFNLLGTLTGEGSFEDKMKKVVEAAGTLETTIKDNINENIKTFGDNTATTFKKMADEGNRFVDVFGEIYKKVTGKDLNLTESKGVGDSGKKIDESIKPKEMVTPTDYKNDDVNNLLKNKLGVETKTETKLGESTMTVTITHDFKNLPANINTEDLKKVLQEVNVTDVIKQSLESRGNNYGMTKQPY